MRVERGRFDDGALLEQLLQSFQEEAGQEEGRRLLLAGVPGVPSAKSSMLTIAGSGAAGVRGQE